jgi:branched-subunit amino acid transport protein
VRTLVLILAMGGVTYLTRVVPLLALHGRRLSPLVRRFFEGFPVAVLAAFVTPLVLAPGGTLEVSLHNAPLVAAVPTILVALRTKNLLLTVVVGAVVVVAARAVW